MQGIFIYLNFNQDISKWDVSNVTEIHYMLPQSNPTDISKWNIPNYLKQNVFSAGYNQTYYLNRE